MKEKHLLIAVLLLLVSNIFCVIGWNCSINDTAKYYNYYKATEKFLDELDQHYDWVDAFDPYEYYDAVDKIKKG